ncbi:MAG TPA: DUF1887 family CARF protein [Burkholderiaceae bacterium]|nr:DUF1887 family CARF protein [Burkholderiaceae bacterium]
MKTQILLVSAQAAPNLLAAADAELKPECAALVVSEPMQARAAALARVLTELGVTVRQHRLRNEHDPSKIAEDLLNWFSSLEGEDVYLNLTGGTKLMALTALAVAETANWRCFYVDVDTDQVIWLGRDAPPPRKLNEQVRLRHYLAAYGIVLDGELQRREPTPSQLAFVQELLAYYEQYLPALPLLNEAMDRAEDNRSLDIELTDAEADSKSFGRLLEMARQQRMVMLDGRRLRIESEATRSFLKGGWLEQHVFATLAQLHGVLGLRDRAVNVKVRHNDVGNELDVAFLHRNRLHVIECKTGNLRVNDGARANDALFKLAENTRRLGGLATRAMLVSYRPLRDSELRLAELLQIEVVHGREVARLREKLRAWCGAR